MVEVVPVQAFGIVNLIVLAHPVKVHEPVAVNENGLHLLHAGTEIVDHDFVAHELRLVHVERCGKDVDVHHGIEIRGDEKVLVLFHGTGFHAHGVVACGDELELIRPLFNSGDCTLCSRLRNGGDVDGIERALLRLNREHLSHTDVFIQFRARVQGINDFGHKVRNAFRVKEGGGELFTGDGGLVENAAVDFMEHSRDVRNLTFEHRPFGQNGVERFRGRHVDEHFFNRLTHLEHTTLEGFQRVGIALARDDDTGNTVDQHMQEFILCGLVLHHCIANFLDVVAGGNGDAFLIGGRSSVANGVQNLNTVKLRIKSLRNSRHNLHLTSS